MLALIDENLIVTIFLITADLSLSLKTTFLAITVQMTIDYLYPILLALIVMIPLIFPFTSYEFMPQIIAMVVLIHIWLDSFIHSKRVKNTYGLKHE